MIYKGQELEEWKQLGLLKRPFINLSRKIMGSWYVICRAPNTTTSEYFWCECLTCNSIHKILSQQLKSGKSKGCNECYKKRRIQIKNENFIWHYLQKIKQRAKKKNIKIDLTPEYIWEVYIKQNKKCALSGIDINFCISWNRSRWLHSASLDRIDSSKGYIKGNIQFVHKDINIMKMDFDQKYFIDTCKLIAENNKVKDNSNG